MNSQILLCLLVHIEPFLIGSGFIGFPHRHHTITLAVAKSFNTRKGMNPETMPVKKWSSMVNSLCISWCSHVVTPSSHVLMEPHILWVSCQPNGEFTLVMPWLTPMVPGPSAVASAFAVADSVAWRSGKIIFWPTAPNCANEVAMYTTDNCHTFFAYTHFAGKAKSVSKNSQRFGPSWACRLRFDATLSNSGALLSPRQHAGQSDSLNF